MKFVIVVGLGPTYKSSLYFRARIYGDGKIYKSFKTANKKAIELRHKFSSSDYEVYQLQKVEEND